MLTADISGNTQVNTSPMCLRGQNARSLVEENNKKIAQNHKWLLGMHVFFFRSSSGQQERARLAGRDGGRETTRKGRRAHAQ